MSHVTTHCRLSCELESMLCNLGRSFDMQLSRLISNMPASHPICVRQKRVGEIPHPKSLTVVAVYLQSNEFKSPQSSCTRLSHASSGIQIITEDQGVYMDTSEGCSPPACKSTSRRPRNSSTMDPHGSVQLASAPIASGRFLQNSLLCCERVKCLDAAREKKPGETARPHRGRALAASTLIESTKTIELVWSSPCKSTEVNVCQ